jgi:hypothetical protein
LVTRERASPAGYVYRVVVHLRESAGVAASITSVDLAFIGDATTVVTSHQDQPTAGQTSICPANGTLDTREFVITDTDPLHPYVTTVQVRVAFSDATSYAGTASGSADVPAVAQGACGYALAPTVPDPAPPTLSSQAVHIVRAAGAGACGWQAKSNASWITFSGNSSGTGDAYLYYSVQANPGAAERSATIVVSWDGGSATLTVSQVGACEYVSVPSGTIDVAYEAGQYTLTLNRTLGSCNWQVSNYPTWILPVGRTSGGDRDTFTYTVTENPSNTQRIGYIYYYLMSGSAVFNGISITVRQSALPTTVCFYTISPTGTLQVPRAGGSFAVTVTRTSGTCGWQASSNVDWLRLVATSGTGSGTLEYTVSANSDSGGRTGAITVTWPGGSAVLSVTQSSVFSSPP